MECVLRASEIIRVSSSFKADGNAIVLVHGPSGVGKTTIVEHCLAASDLHASTLRFEFGNPFSSFKEFLNNVLIFNFGRRNFLDRLFNRQWRIENVTVSSIPGFSVSIYNKDVVANSSEKAGITFSTSTMRLNGHQNQIFFSKLWSCVINENCNIVYFSSLEKATPEDINLLMLVLQTRPEKIRIVLEMASGPWSVSIEQLASVIRQCVPTASLIQQEIKLFDAVEAEKFYMLLQREKDIPTFDYRKNQGHPMAIIFGGDYRRASFDPLALTDELRGDLASEPFLQTLHILLRHTTNRERISRVLAALECFGSFASLISKGIMAARGEDIGYSHYLFRSYFDDRFAVAAFFSADTLAEKLAEVDADAFVRLSLETQAPEAIGHHAGLRQALFKTIAEKLDQHRLNDIAETLGVIKRRSVVFDGVDQIILSLLALQIDVFRYHERDVHDIGTRGATVDAIVGALKVQRLYQSGDFGRVCTKAAEVAARVTHELSASPELQDSILSVLSALSGIAYSYLGDYPRAKEAIADARHLAAPGSVIREYLRTQDAFLLGLEPVAAQDLMAVGTCSSEYVRAKINHNINTARMFFRADDKKLVADFYAYSLQIFAALNCKEMSFTLLNTGVILLNQGDWTRARGAFSSALDRCFEMHEPAILHSNLSVVAALQGELLAAAEHRDAAVEEIDKFQIFDPGVSGRIYINCAWLDRVLGRSDAAGRWIERVDFPIGIRDREYLNDRAERLLRAPADSLLATNTSSNYQEYGWFLPIILHFWDFNCPIIDSSLMHQISDELQSAAA